MREVLLSPTVGMPTLAYAATGPDPTFALSFAMRQDETVGVTHYQHDQLGAIETLMRTEQLDFIQIPYSITDRAVEARILPAALDTGGLLREERTAR